MNHVVILQAGGVSTDWRAKRPFRTLTSRLLTVAAAALLLLVGGGAKSVYADYNVVTYSQTDINNSFLGVANYNQGQVGSSFTRVGGATATGTVDSTGKLTSSFGQTALSTSGQSGNSFASANLSTGALGASANSPFGSTQMGSVATTSFQDVLHFVIPGAGPNTVTNIGVQFTLSGSISAGPDGGAGLGGSLHSEFRIGSGALVTDIFDGRHNGPPCMDFVPCIAAQTPSGWVSYSFTSDTPANIVFNGVFAVQGATANVAVSNYLSLGGAGGEYAFDYSHTSLVLLSLPNAVSYTSDSGVFGTVPPSGTLLVNRKVLNYGTSGSLVTSPQTVLVTIAGGANTPWTATSDHSNITVSPASGAGTGTFQITASPGSSGMVTVTAPGAPNSPQTIQVNVASITPTLPFGSFDTPMTNTTGVVGAIPVTGWALDNIEVTRVDIFREPVAGEPSGNLIFIGTAVFSADARPDVQAMFPAYPYQFRAGWGYQMLTNFLPNASGSGASGNGSYKLHAIAFNKAGSQLDLGIKLITVDNAHAAKPFGTIDTPGQGGTISGTDSVNFGWALTPQAAMISTDGSTITVVIDGVSAGHPTYGQFRSDIANLFPGYANSGGAVGFFHINTTTLANGVHTISWNAFDNQQRGEGLGSRYFNVLNTSGASAVAAPEDVIDESDARQGVRIRHGLNINREPDPIAPDADGGYSVTMEEVGHIELHLGAVNGNMLVQGEAQTLPTGSTLKGGVFYWQPGPGFLGEYSMQFERPDGTKIPVRVNIVPKRY
jgi:hypothetical protein